MLPIRFIPPNETDHFYLGTTASAAPTPTEAPLVLESWLRKNTRQYPVTLNLPPDLFQWIGVIASYWATAEWIQVGTLACMLRIDRKKARVICGDRVGNCTSKVKQIMEMDSIPLPENIKNGNLSRDLNACERARNLICHGVWILDPVTQEICIQNPAEEWVDGQNRKSGVSKRKYPEAFYPDTAWFEGRLSDIKRVIRDIQALDTYLERFYRRS